MLEARITYIDGKTHTVEANTLEILKEKCKPYIADERVYDIWIAKIEGVGWFKSLFVDELL